MSATSLERKTVRPGSLLGYSYYHSSRRPVRSGKTAVPLRRSGSLLRRHGTLLTLIVLALLGVAFWRSQAGPAKPTATLRPAAGTHASAPKSTPKPTPAPAPAAPAAAAPAPTNYCAGNSSGQLILVSISQRHLWACQAAQSVYDSPVVTGIDYLAADKTPTGTYRIYAKNIDIYLKGSDSTGSWDDYVYYWMPFLHNQYGSYGFHDATWRSDSAFGNISPDSSDASHGCVELPLATAKWLYGWAGVGTTVTIED